MDEGEFISSIDCSFPYMDESAWKEAIRTGIAISDNAAYMVLHEICRPPRSIPTENRLRILSEWDRGYGHPVKKIVVESAMAIIKNDVIPTEIALGCMKRISEFKGLYNALAIVCSSCDDMHGKVDEFYDEIIQDWEKR